MPMIGVGVIGVGRMGTSHAQVYSQLDGVTLIGVADREGARATHLATVLGTEGYSDYMAFLQRPDLDAVSICTPDHGHLEPALAAARLGKHILVEKPLAATLPDCDAIINSCERNGVILMVGHILRFDPRYVRVRETVAAGELGNIVHAFARRNDIAANAGYYKPHTNLPLYLGVHDLDILMWILGSRPQSVYAASSDAIVPEQGGGDSVISVLQFPSDIVACLGISWAVPKGMPSPRASLEVMGTRGMALIDIYDQGVTLCTDASLIHPDVTYRPLVHGRLTGILVDEIRYFVSAVQQGGQPLVGGQEGRAAVKVALAVERSLAEMQPVVLDWSSG